MLESQDTFSVQDIYVVKGLTKPLLGRPAIQALGIIISNVNSSSVDADYPNTFKIEFPGPDNFLSDLIKVCPFIPLKSLSEIGITVTSAPVSILKPLLGRPAIQALGIIISNVNSSSVDADLGTQKTESYYRLA
jgi:hypothetical protein